MLIVGSQLRAARALAGVGQRFVAARAGLNVNTVRAMEACGAADISSSLANVRRVQGVLEASGVEFTLDPRPGVRLQSGANDRGECRR